MADAPRTAQINLKLSGKDFGLICEAASRHHVKPMRYCIDLVLASAQTLSPLAGDTPRTPALHTDVPTRIEALHTMVEGLQSRLAELAVHVTTFGSHTQSTALATLEQVVAVRTVLQNFAAATFKGEGEMDELRAFANTSAPEMAADILNALARRPDLPATLDTPLATKPERTNANA